MLFSLSSLIISHFLLNLRQIANDRMIARDSNSEQQDGLSTPASVLSSFLGNMGEFLDYHPGDDNIAAEDGNVGQHDEENVYIRHHGAGDLLDKHIPPTQGHSRKQPRQGESVVTTV